MARSLFCKSFRGAVGATPIHYLKTVRLELAASLLRQTGLPLSELAHRVGYKSDEAFLRAFQSGYGVTPGRFRSANSSRSAEHTSELQSLMRSSYAVFCLKQKYTDAYQHVYLTTNKTTSQLHTN